MNKYLLKDFTKIDISGVDKKVKENEIDVKLCNFTDVYKNWAITSKMYKQFMCATATKNEIDRYRLKKGMLAITKDSETRDDIGMATYIADSFEDVILGYHTALIMPDNSKVNSKFLNAYLNSKIARKHFSNSASGSGQRYTLTVDSIGNLPLYLPSLEIQEKIGEFLSNIDKKIDNNSKINDNLEELLKTIYQRWFIEYEFLDNNGKAYKSAGGKLVYNEKLKREIPSGWIVENCFENSLFEILKPGVEHFNNKNYLATANINDEDIIDGEWITFENRESRANMQPVSNSIWFAKMKNSVKHLTLVKDSQWFIDKYILSTGFLGIKCKNNSLAYMHSFIYSDYFEKVKNMLSHGATQEAINNDDLKHINLVIPSKDVLERYDKITENILKEKDNIIHENQRLNELKEYLLPLLMNGQINVDDIEI